MVFFGNKALKESEAKAREAERIKKATTKSIKKTQDSVGTLHDLLKANGITLGIHIATGGKHG